MKAIGGACVCTHLKTEVGMEEDKVVIVYVHMAIKCVPNITK